MTEHAAYGGLSMGACEASGDPRMAGGLMKCGEAIGHSLTILHMLNAASGPYRRMHLGAPFAFASVALWSEYSL